MRLWIDFIEPMLGDAVGRGGGGGGGRGVVGGRGGWCGIGRFYGVFLVIISDVLFFKLASVFRCHERGLLLFFFERVEVRLFWSLG